MNRRKFLKFLGVAPVAVATAGVALVGSASSRHMVIHDELHTIVDTETHHVNYRDIYNAMSPAVYHFKRDDMIVLSIVRV